MRAPAKINLCLLVKEKRPDGYHEIETVMAKVNLYDELIIKKTNSQCIKLNCMGPYPAPQGKENLVYQACEKVLESCSIAGGFDITLTKNIPAGAGLGSASTDAAAALLGINRLFKLNMTAGQIRQMAEQLGSDVPFFTDGPIAFCTGRGEKICPIKQKHNFDCILVLPGITVSTASVYENYQHRPARYYDLKKRLNDYICENRIDLLFKMCANMLEETCCRLYKEVAKLKHKIEMLQIGPVGMTGSGAGLFCKINAGQKCKTKVKQRIEHETHCRTVVVHNNRW